MAAFRLRKPGGGSALRGVDGFRADEVQVFEYIGSGGAVAGGSAVATGTRQDESGHGAGYLVTRTTGVPIRRRQYGHAAVFEHVGSGGSVNGGSAVVEFSSGNDKRRDEDEFLLLMAA